MNFGEFYYFWNFGIFLLFEGWEIIEKVWVDVLVLEVLNSGYNVVMRVVFFVGKCDFRGLFRELIENYKFEWVVVDIGYIFGEVYGYWENWEWCEYRG